MTALPAELVLAGRRAVFVWDEPAGAIPAAVLVDHGDHTFLVPWAGELGAVTLESLLPLTVAEPVTCPGCGVEGRIREGEWLAVARG